MSKWAQKRKKRIILIISSLLLVIVIILFFSLTNKKPTCSDGIQNGTETGIDCGGSCQKVCSEEARNLVVWWERPFKVSDGVYNAVAYFENQNLNSGISEITYEFRLYDKDNILVAKPRIGKTFVEPNKRSAIFESGIETGSKEAYTAFLKISPVKNWMKTNTSFSYGLFNIGDPQLSNQENYPKLKVSIENKSHFNFRDIPVVAILYNNKGNAIAASQTYIDLIEQGKTAEVYYSWPEPFEDIVSRIEIIPRVDPFTPIETITR